MNIENSFIRFLTRLTCTLLLSVLSISAQEKKNLQVFYELVDSSVINATSFIPDSIKDIKLDLNKGTFAVFNSEIISCLTGRGYRLANEGNSPEIQILFSNAVTSYGEMFRDGFLGDYYLPRKITLSGSYNFSGKKIFTRSFSYSLRDTVNADSISMIENSAYPFTQGELPPEPFFSGILEPLVAVGTAALAVILFFTIRSK